MDIRHDVPLAPLTTLELGGQAEHFVEAHDDTELSEALRWAKERALAASFLGGGSNVVVPEEGVRGLVVHVVSRGVHETRAGERVLVTAAAGEPWDTLVERTVAEGLAGLECLGGIPGAVGATPIQNVGAYGQDVSESIESVEVLDTRSLERRVLRPADCAFGYRVSALKRVPGRFVVLAVTFALRPGGAPKVAYAELARVAPSGAGLSDVHRAVIGLRRAKSMVLDPADPNRRSAGSFFTNPIVDERLARDVVGRALALGVVRREEDVPHWAEGDRVKLAAGWLIEHAGFSRGTRRGHVGTSTAHALALVHHGGGTTKELLAYASEIVDGVRERWGVSLEREPRLLGIDG